MPEFDAENRKKDIREVYDQVPEGVRSMPEACLIFEGTRLNALRRI